MAVNTNVPAEAGLGIVFGQNIHSSSQQDAGTSSISHATTVRAHSEPANLSYQPELYRKLQSLWEQTSVLISASHPSQPESVCDIDDDEDDDDDDDDDDDESDTDLQSRSETDGKSNPSVVDAPIFRLLYSNQAALHHFATTKEQLPFREITRNRAFMGWVAAKEGGLRLNYEQIRYNLQRLHQEPTLRRNSPQVFSFFENLLNIHQGYLYAGAQFLNYDLYNNMMESYFGARGDVGLLARFPITTSQAFESYIHESARQMSEESLAERDQVWDTYRSEWLKAETELLKVKNDKDLARRYDQLQKLMKIFHSRRLEITGRQRANRRALTLRRETKRRSLKDSTAQNLHHQPNQPVLRAHTDEQIEVLRSQIGKGVCQAYDDDDEYLPDQMNGMRIEDRPHTFVDLMT